MVSCGIIPFLRPSLSSLKEKKASQTEKNRVEKRKPTKKLKNPGEFRAAMAMAATMVRPYALDQPSWAYWASFASSLDLVWPQCLYFRCA